MPIYEYQCQCGKRFEELRSMEKRHDAVCPRCSKVPKLLISQLAKRNPFDLRIPLTVYNHDGSVVGRRFDHRPTPYPEEYYDVKKIREQQMVDAKSIEAEHKEALCQN